MQISTYLIEHKESLEERKEAHGWAQGHFWWHTGNYVLINPHIIIYTILYTHTPFSHIDKHIESYGRESKCKIRSIAWTHRQIHTPDPFQNAGDPDGSIQCDTMCVYICYEHLCNHAILFICKYIYIIIYIYVTYIYIYTCMCMCPYPYKIDVFTDITSHWLPE